MKARGGDVGFSHSNGAMGRLIRLGEWMRFRRGSRWNHQFIVSDETAPDGCPLVIQATLRGVTKTARLDSMGDYVTMPPPAGTNRAKVLAFAHAQVGIEYGILTILAIALDIVTWNWVPSFRGARRQSWICSALANEALRFGGWLHPWIDIYDVTPAQGFAALMDD